MAKRAQKKKKRDQKSTFFTKKTFFESLLTAANIFIFIGEKTREILLISDKNFARFEMAFNQTLNRVHKKYTPIVSSNKKKLTSRKKDVVKVKKTVLHYSKSFKKYIFFITKFFGIFFLKIIRRIIRAISFFLGIIWKVLASIFLFIIFLLKKPIQLLFSLFTVQLRFFLLGVFICAIFFVSRELHQFVLNLPSPRDIGKVNYSLSTHIMDKNGKLLYDVYRDQNRTPVVVSTLPKYISRASIAIEDKDFYQHKGISLVSGILRAIKETVFKGSLQGGSTITQQLVKTSLLTPERTVIRKVKEIILALWTEQIYTKDQILEMYLNQVPYGGAAYGIQEASRTYFGKDAKNLSIAEAALLAGLPQAPSVYSPFVNPRLALARRNDVLEKMKEQKYITDDQYKESVATPLDIVKPEINIKSPHFVFYVKSELEKQFGSRTVEEGGLNVLTSLDLDIQQETEKILKDELQKQKYLNVSNGAVLVIKPSTGEIVAMAGSIDYFAKPDGAFNVTTAERQPGSSLKPLLYSLALQKGYTAATVIDDSPTTFNMPGAEPYRPINYDGRFHGRVSLRIALANSYNIPAVKTLSSVGIDSFVTYMKSLGITTWNDPGRYVLPMALGGVEVKMVDEAGAYQVLANRGNKLPISGILEVKDSDGVVLQKHSVEGNRVMPEAVSYIVSDMLSDNFARTLTFGPGSQLEIPGYKVSVKTGTTDSKRDNWTFGYTPEYLVAVWIGNNDNTPMNPAIESGATGASSLWHRVMNYVLTKKTQHPKEWFPQPEDVVQKTCFFGRPEYFIRGTENTVGCIAPTSVPFKNNPQFRQPNQQFQPSQQFQPPQQQNTQQPFQQPQQNQQNQQDQYQRWQQQLDQMHFYNGNR